MKIRIRGIIDKPISINESLWGIGLFTLAL
jgi:hypothetical protein